MIARYSIVSNSHCVINNTHHSECDHLNALDVYFTTEQEKISHSKR